MAKPSKGDCEEEVKAESLVTPTPGVLGKDTAVKQLTSHISTRYYRAPENILMCQDYSLPSDVWSAGVIFGELLKMIEDNCPKLEDRTPLLPGKFCFPLSPRKRRIADDGLPVKNDND